jgi:NAD(P)-dependent dehydrogenase (short-subunit alcohol dehydrogenase family)
MPLRDEFRTALITGAASGLGAAFAAMLRAEGVEVWGTSRDRGRVPEADGLHGLALELGDEASIAAAWAEAERASGGIDLVINNAGAGVFGPFQTMDEAAWSRQIQILLVGPASLARHALRAMHDRGRGCLVNVTSLAAEFPIPCMSAYDAAKAGLVGFTACLALECEGTPVRIVDFRPGDYRTSFNDAMRGAAEPDEGAPARVWRRLEALMSEAPEPRRAAADLRRALARRRGGVVRSGSYFQARVAPLLQRFASQRLSAWVQRRYFDLR